MATVNIEDKLYESIKDYCKLNKLTIGTFINDLLKKNFMVEKYDDAPPFFKKKVDEKKIEKIVVEEVKEEPIEAKEPVKKEDYMKPEVVVKEKEKEELSPKEKARRRVKYL